MTLTLFIQTYWPPIVSIASVAIGWWRMSIKLAEKKAVDDQLAKELELRMTKMETKVEAIFPDINIIKTDVAVMKNTLEYIKGSITQISSGGIQIQK